MEAEGQTRYPTLLHEASAQLTSHFLFLFSGWVGSIVDREEKILGLTGKGLEPLGRSFTSCPGRSTDFGNVPRSAGECGYANAHEPLSLGAVPWVEGGQF